MISTNNHIRNKRLAALIMALCLMFSAAAALADVPDEAEVIRIATEAVRAQVTLTDEEWSKLSVGVYDQPLEGHSDSVWSVEFVLPLELSRTALYTVAIEKQSGGVLRVYADENAYNDALRAEEGYHVMQQWEKDKGNMYYWSQQDKVDFFSLYFGGDYRMPGEGDLTNEQAIEIATKYAVDNWGMSVDYLSGLHTSVNLTTANESEPSQWIVYFVDENIRSSVDGIVAPHMVVIDNATGEVLNALQGDTHGVG